MPSPSLAPTPTPTPERLLTGSNGPVRAPDLLAQVQGNIDRIDQIIGVLESHQDEQIRQLSEDDKALAEKWREVREALAEDLRPAREKFLHRTGGYYHTLPNGKVEIRQGQDHFGKIASLICQEGVSRYAIPFNPEAFKKIEGRIKDLDRFVILPMGAKRQHGSSNPSVRGSVPGPIRKTYKSYGGTLALDGYNGFALLYRDDEGSYWMLAMTAARITEDNDLVITQIQDVTGVRMDGPHEQQAAEGQHAESSEPEQHKRRNQAKNKEYYETPLQAKNLDWKALFVMLWMRVGEEFGVRNLVIKANRNHIQYPQVQEGQSYDHLAERLGFTPWKNPHNLYDDWAINLIDGQEPIGAEQQASSPEAKSRRGTFAGALIRALGTLGLARKGRHSP